MQLLLIRHSITAGNLEHRYIGWRTDQTPFEAPPLPHRRTALRSWNRSGTAEIG